MAKYKSVVITNAGLELVAAAHSGGGTIQFTGIKTGNGVYDGTEVLEDMTSLKSVKQTFGITGITREAAVVKIRSALSNEGVTEGYYMTEIGVYVSEPETSTEILYAIIIAEDDMADYFTPYKDSPQNITLEVYVAAAGLAEGVTFTASIIPGTYATAQDLEDYRIEVKAVLEDKVDKVDGKGLSTEDYTTEEKTKLSGIEDGANAYTHPEITTEKGTTVQTLEHGDNFSAVNGLITDESGHLKAIVTGKYNLPSGVATSSKAGLMSADDKNKLDTHTEDTSNPHNVTKAQIGLGNVDNKSSETIRSELTSANVTTALGYTPLNSTLKGANSGLAELDANGKVPTSQLPSYVDDVLEYSSKSAFPATGESGKIYIATDTNLQYRWSGTAYAEISSSLALGETSSTAYRGDRGATAYTHSQKTSGNPHGVTKSDVGLGNVPNVATNDQTPTYTAASANATLTSGEKLSVAFGKIAKAISSLISHLANTSNPHSVTVSQIGAASSSHTHNYAGSSSAGGAATSALKLNSSVQMYTNLESTDDYVLVNGTKATSVPTYGTLPISKGGTGATDAATARTNLGAAAASHTHSEATTSAAGFMSASDKTKLDKYCHTVYINNISKITIDGFNSSSTYQPFAPLLIYMATPGYGGPNLYLLKYVTVTSSGNTIYVRDLASGTDSNGTTISLGSGAASMSFTASVSGTKIILTKTNGTYPAPVTFIGQYYTVE